MQFQCWPNIETALILKRVSMLTCNYILPNSYIIIYDLQKANKE